MSRVPVLLYGAAGRMGRAIRESLPGAPELELLACVAPRRREESCPEGCRWLTPEELASPGGIETLPPDLVILDVSVAAGTEQLVPILELAPRALVAATTGLRSQTEDRIEALARKTPVLRSRNLSLGNAIVAAWLRALPVAARTAFEADIVEHHHTAKKDAPSGTATTLAALLDSVGTERRSGGVQVHSIRGGTVPGTHEVILSGEGEVVRIRHDVQDRAVFARGALRAARYLHRKPAGFYTFDQTLT